MEFFKTKKDGKKDADLVIRAYETLNAYKAGKASVDSRIIDSEQWWKMRHHAGKDSDVTPSAWLFNAIINKHADAMDNLPTVTCLPREAGDSAAARLLSQIIPVILEENKFESTYSECWYDKLKGGSTCYGVFWDPTLSGGIGNVDIRRIDILNLFWEPGITDIQHSKNIFHVELHHNDELRARYPALADSLSSPDFDPSRYVYEDSIDTSDKSAVVDWYYKKKDKNGTAVHFCKICNGVVLYSSERDDRCKKSGFYSHGKYPFVIDSLYPVKGSPCGFGLIDLMKGTQAQIDTLGSSIVKNARMAAERRYFVRADGAVNEKEFADFTRPFVHYQGSGDPNASIMPIVTPSLSDTYVSILNSKKEELKETSGNYDLSQGQTAGGVTAAAAIAALQEAGSKTSRDMISASYRAFEEVCSIVICLIAGFYTVPRCFRITGADSAPEFVYCSAADLSPLSALMPLYDLKIHAHKRSAFSRASANELALELYRMGVFSAERSREAKIMLSLMEFEGKDEALAAISEEVARAKGDIGGIL